MSLKQEIEKCEKCPLRKKLDGYETPVMGVGSNSPLVMFIIDNKKKAEDVIDGLPLLYIEDCLKQFGIPKSVIYITPYVKCQRLPTKKAISSCEDWLKKEVEVFKPKIVVTFGKINFESALNIPVSLNELSKNPKGEVTMILFKKIKELYEFHEEQKRRECSRE